MKFISILIIYLFSACACSNGVHTDTVQQSEAPLVDTFINSFAKVDASGKIKKSINVLLTTMERGIPYVELEDTSDESVDLLNEIFFQAANSCMSNTMPMIEGVEYTVSSGIVTTVTIWIEVEHVTNFPPVEQWLSHVGDDWQKANRTWTKTPPRIGQAYWGFKFQKDFTSVISGQPPPATSAHIDYYKFFFITEADKALAGGAPAGYLQTICESNYKAVIDAGVKRMTSSFTTGAVTMPGWVGNNKTHAQEFFMVDPTCNKDVKKQCKTYLDYVLSISPYRTQLSNPPGPKGPNGAQRAIFQKQ